jgi:sensor histidine kinase YesM
MNRCRFWTIYVAAWLPYALSYYVLFRLLPGNLQPVRQVLYNVLPAAALGVSILPWTRMLSWRFHRVWWFYPAQVASAATYSLLWYFGVLVAGSLGQALTTHHVAFAYFSEYAAQWQFFSGLMIYGNVAGVSYVMQVNAHLRAERRRRELAEALRNAAELSSLRAQLNPHFLFNTLNSIMALAGPDQPQTMRAIAHLASMLRYTLGRDASGDDVSLREELQFTEQYLQLESLRLGSRLVVQRIVAPEALTCRLPPLTLQPLVENAIRHGIAPRVGIGTVTIRAQVNDGTLLLVVSDDGAGASPSDFETRAGLGVRTVRQRVALFTNHQGGIGIESMPGHGCTVSIRMPVDEDATEQATEQMLAQDIA